jgi:hypothetical protein
MTFLAGDWRGSSVLGPITPDLFEGVQMRLSSNGGRIILGLALCLVASPLAAEQTQGSGNWSPFHPWYCNNGLCMLWNPENTYTGQSHGPCSAEGYFGWPAVEFCVHGTPF